MIRRRRLLLSESFAEDKPVAMPRLRHWLHALKSLPRPRLAILLCAGTGSLLVVASNISAVAHVNGPTSSTDAQAHAQGHTLSATMAENNTRGSREQSVVIQPALSFVLASTPSTSARTGMTTDDNVNMRTGPGTDYKIVAQLPIDTPAQIMGEQAGWYHIVTPWATDGWVSAGFFKITRNLSGEQSPSIGSAATVGVVNMRTGPGIGYPVTGKLSDSTVLEVLALQGTWYKVRSATGNIGGVAAEFVPLDWIPEVYGGSIGSNGGSGSSGNNIPTSASSDVVRITQTYLGARYVWGGSDPSGFDCSGLTWYVYHQLGVRLPGGSIQQFSSRYGRFIRSTSSLAPGDLAFFERTTDETGITHVGIYVDNNKMIAARSERLGVRYVSLLDPFWSSRFVGGIRPYR